MSRLRRHEGVDSVAQTLGATETVTMSLATTRACALGFKMRPAGVANL